MQVFKSHTYDSDHQAVKDTTFNIGFEGGKLVVERVTTHQTHGISISLVEKPDSRVPDGKKLELRVEVYELQNAVPNTRGWPDTRVHTTLIDLVHRYTPDAEKGTDHKH